MDHVLRKAPVKDQLIPHPPSSSSFLKKEMANAIFIIIVAGSH
jgi:hypothetical protein